MASHQDRAVGKAMHGNNAFAGAEITRIEAPVGVDPCNIRDGRSVIVRESPTDDQFAVSLKDKRVESTAPYTQA